MMRYVQPLDLKERLHTFQLQFSVLNQLKLFFLKCLIHVGGFMWSESSPNSGDLSRFLCLTDENLC